MKKRMKKMIMAMIIVLTFGLSSIAFVIVSFNGPQTQRETKQLDKFVIDGELDQNTAYEYYINGYTFMKFYYSDPSVIGPYIDQLPDNFRTNNDQIQLIIEKIPYNETYISVINFNSEDNIYNITEQTIYDSLCNNLLSIPIECLSFDVENISSGEADDSNTTNMSENQNH